MSFQDDRLQRCSQSRLRMHGRAAGMVMRRARRWSRRGRRGGRRAGSPRRRTCRGRTALQRSSPRPGCRAGTPRRGCRAPGRRYGRIGLISWVTKSTAVSCSRRRLVDQVDHHLLVGEVERQQRLVAQQHGRVGGQRLRDPKALLLAAGQLSERHVGVRRRLHLTEQLVDPRPP